MTFPINKMHILELTCVETHALPWLLCLMFLIAGCGRSSNVADKKPSYSTVTATTIKLMNQGKLEEAYLTASAAIILNDKRWEAYALRGMNLHAKGADKEAAADLEKALLRAPESKKAVLRRMLGSLSAPLLAPAVSSSTPASTEAPAQLGMAEVTSEPSGASVLQNGHLIGRTPLTLPNLQQGEIALELELDGYAPTNVVGTVVAGETLALNAGLGRPLKEIKKEKFINRFVGTWQPVLPGDLGNLSFDGHNLLFSHTGYIKIWLDSSGRLTTEGKAHLEGNYKSGLTYDHELYDYDVSGIDVEEKEDDFFIVEFEVPPTGWTRGGEHEKEKPPCPRKPNRTARPTTLSSRSKPCSWSSPAAGR